MGVKVIEITQVAPAARLAPQVLVWVNCAAFAPVMLMPVMLSTAVPGLDSVTVCAALVVPVVRVPNARVAGLSTACGASGAMPEPVSETDCGEPVALSATETAAE